MPISPSLVTHIEVTTFGVASAQGSNSKNIELVTHWRRTATVATLSKTNIDTAYQAAIVVPYGAALNVSYTQQYNLIRFLNDAEDANVSFSHAVAGAITGDRMAITNAAFILMRSGKRGRRFKGSKHLGPMSESDTTGGSADIFNAGALTNLNAVAAAILAGFTDSNGNVWVPSIVSRVLSQLRVNPTNVVSNDAIQVVTNKRVGTMKRRHVKSVY